MLKKTGIPLLTKHFQAHYADKAYMGNNPVAYVKAGKKEDFLTPLDLIEQLYDRPVECVYVLFKDGTRTVIKH